MGIKDKRVPDKGGSAFILIITLLELPHFPAFEENQPIKERVDGKEEKCHCPAVNDV